MPMGLSTSIAAPVSERLRTVQLMLPPPIAGHDKSACERCLTRRSAH
jgi:hypothetical protein